MLLLLVFLTYISDEKLRLAGGSVHFLECAKRWIKEDDLKIITLTTPLGARALAKRGFHSELILVDPLCEGRSDNLSIIVSWLSRCIAIIRTRQEIGNDRKVVIVTESHLLPDVFAGLNLQRRFRGSTLFCYLHHLIPEPQIRTKYHPLLPSIFGWMAQELSLLLLKTCNFKIFTYGSNESVLRGKDFRPSALIPTASGVDIDAAANGHSGERPFDACFLGRLSPLKGVMDLVVIWRMVCGKLPNAKLAIIGFGADKGYLRRVQRRIEQERMGKNIEFFPEVYGDQKFTFLKSSKLLVSASREEGWGISICEAMACGLPVVAYDLESYRWAFQEGILRAPLGDVTIFAQFVTSLLTDDELRSAVGKQALEQSRKYDWDEIAKNELSKIYEIGFGTAPRKGKKESFASPVSKPP
jgi:glycosyltransferase involved in cell wall biosynthesis